MRPCPHSPRGGRPGDLFSIIFESNSAVNMEWFKFCMAEVANVLAYLHQLGPAPSSGCFAISPLGLWGGVEERSVPV